MPSVRQKAYYPLALISAVAAYFALLPSVSNEGVFFLVAAISYVFIVVVHVSEKIWPARKEWNVNRGDFRSDLVFTNLLLPALSKGAEIFLAWAILAMMSESMHQGLTSLWPHESPILVQGLLALLVCEFLFYWAHRLFHQVHALWLFHSIHHAVKRVYWNNSGRFHPVDLFVTWVFYYLPLAVFGVSPQVMGFFLIMNAVTGLLEHANVDFKAGWLNRLFNTAELHRWHHSAEPEVSSMNFGKVLSIWDQVFGTYYLPAGKEVGEVGIVTESVPEGVRAQMAYPFRPLTKILVSEEKSQINRGTR